jgi:hypothetical protein
MATLSNITVKKELRLCKVNEEPGYFHCWEQYADVIAPGLTVGSHPGGQYSKIFGIVEFVDRIERVDPPKIQFVDDTNSFLHSQKKYLDSI